MSRFSKFFVVVSLLLSVCSAAFADDQVTATLKIEREKAAVFERFVDWHVFLNGQDIATITNGETKELPVTVTTGAKNKLYIQRKGALASSTPSDTQEFAAGAGDVITMTCGPTMFSGFDISLHVKQANSPPATLKVTREDRWRDKGDNYDVIFNGQNIGVIGNNETKEFSVLLNPRSTNKVYIQDTGFVTEKSEEREFQTGAGAVVRLNCASVDTGDDKEGIDLTLKVEKPGIVPAGAPPVEPAVAKLVNQDPQTALLGGWRSDAVPIHNKVDRTAFDGFQFRIKVRNKSSAPNPAISDLAGSFSTLVIFPKDKSKVATNIVVQAVSAYFDGAGPNETFHREFTINSIDGRTIQAGFDAWIKLKWNQFKLNLDDKDPNLLHLEIGDYKVVLHRVDPATGELLGGK